MTRRKHDRVARILAREHAADLESVRKQRRHVLAAVNGEVDVAGQQGVLDFFHEQPLAPDLRERRLAQAVAGRLDDDDLAQRSDAIAEEAGDGIGLIERERAAAGADPECRSSRVLMQS